MRVGPGERGVPGRPIGRRAHRLDGEPDLGPRRSLLVLRRAQHFDAHQLALLENILRDREVASTAFPLLLARSTDARVESTLLAYRGVTLGNWLLSRHHGNR